MFSPRDRSRSSKAALRRPRHSRRRIPEFELLEEQVLLSTFYVTNTNDSGDGSLRAAIEAVNASPAQDGWDTIEASGDGTGWIAVGSPLPALTRDQVTIQGLQIQGDGAGGQGGLDIETTDVNLISLAVEGFGTNGAYVNGDGVDLLGCTISGNAGAGLVILGSSCDVQACRLTENSNEGIAIYGGNNRIGAETPDHPTTAPNGGNLISGNGGGITLFGPEASGNVIQNNAVGVSPDGESAWGNRAWGIFLQDAPNNLIGGVNDFDRGFYGIVGNVISGNDQGGLAVRGAGSVNDWVEGNTIGTDVTGSVPIGNGYSGIYVGDWGVAGDAPSSIQIGGTDPGARNVIAANGNYGVWVGGAGVSSILVQGNFIGTDASGTVGAGFGNAYSGVQVDSGAANVTIGGTTAGAGNVISGNGNGGVFLTGAAAASVRGNLIGTDVSGSSPIGNAFWGVYVSNSPDTTVAGNVVSGNGEGGIVVSGSPSSGAAIQGNVIGLAVDKSSPLGNGFSGILIGAFASSDDTAADGVAVSGNLISANGNYGVWITDGSSGDSLTANIIGTDAAGDAGLGNAGEGVYLESGASNNTIGGTTPGAGNVIAGNGSWATATTAIPNLGIVGEDTTGNLVQGNFIGTNAAGASGLNPPHSFGVGLGGTTGNSIGGTSAGAGNVISGNDSSGVLILGGSANLIAGNKVGVDPTGDSALPNGTDGVIVEDSSGNTIGGTSPAARNVISGNGSRADESYTGLLITGAGATGNLVQGNDIGTDASGARAIPNYGSGIAVEDGADDNTIGGTAPGAGNLISGNGQPGAISPGNGFGSGINIQSLGAIVSGTLIQGNLIGTDATGTLPLGNLLDGVNIQDGSSDNTVGGTAAGAGNIIAYNADSGVRVGVDASDDSVRNAILGNSIFGNADLGINLGDESSPVVGAFSGPNDLQPAPVITSAVLGGSHTTIAGTLTAAASTTYRLEFFSNPAGTGQGKTFLGYVTVVTDASGHGSFSDTIAVAVSPGLNITATATDSAGNTSEFSSPVAVRTDVTASLSVKRGGFVYNRVTRQFSQALTITNSGPTTLAGPVDLVLLSLLNATLANGTGTVNGSPYITILSGAPLKPGQSTTVTLLFSDPTLAAISYSPQFLL